MTVFEGYCQHCDETHGLPTTPEVLAKARERSPQLENALDGNKGRMLGVLQGVDLEGRCVWLYGYSGTTALPGLEVGWSPTTRPTEVTQEEEASTFSILNDLTRKIETFPVDDLLAAWESAQDEFNKKSLVMQQERKLARGRRKALRKAEPDNKKLLEDLKNQSFDESTIYRRTMAGLRAPVDALRLQLDDAISRRLQFKQERRRLSLSLQASFMASHALANFRNESVLLEDAVLPGTGVRQGAGECAAPKLLIDAARRGIRPVALGEVWVGPPQEDPPRNPGEAYGPCEERCIPLMGYLLCGMERMPRETDVSKHILQTGEEWVACSKPGGLLSVPGRGSEKVDSMLSRVRHQYARGAEAEAAHRLDLETSGIQVFSLTKGANSSIQSQFANRTTEKVYLAWVEGSIEAPSGRIDLPLRQIDRYVRGHEVAENGKPALTDYEVVKRVGDRTLLALYPKTGRTHQLRVHCADHKGLGAPIAGDSLYGTGKVGDVLYLHAWKLHFDDPTTGERVSLEAPIPKHWP